MINTIIKIIFPLKCIFCSNIITFKTENEICETCHEKISFFYLSHSYNQKNNFKGLYYDDLICVFKYSGIIKEAITRYKFFNKSSYYRTFSNLLATEIKKSILYQTIDFILEVPLHKNKEKVRGYNQSKLIAKYLSKLLKIPYLNILIRTKETKPQSKLIKEERNVNIKNAFIVKNTTKINEKNILIIDDILTTGSTLEECSRVLKECGAQKVISAVIASGRNC